MTPEEKAARQRGYYAKYRATHLEERRAADRIRARIDRATNPDKYKVITAGYRERHRDEIRSKSRLADYNRTHRQELKAYRAEHKDEFRAKRIARTYHVSYRDAEMLQSLRDGPGAWCDICRRMDTRLVIDHDHVTGMIRGILCRPCNRTVGRIETSGFSMNAALAYLGHTTVST